jgi:mono/diheme cytochrome c family protein
VTTSGHAVEFTVETGSNFKARVAQDDLLAGIPFQSNLELAAGDFFKLTDGLGSKPNIAFRTFARDGVEDWVITFSNLKIVEIKEIRVFSWNGDYRAQQGFDLAYSMDRGKTFVTLAKRILAPENGACNLTRIPCSLTKVTDLRFVFRNPGDDLHPKNTRHSSLLEIDAIGIPVVPLTLAEAKDAGRANSALLAGHAVQGRKDGLLPKKSVQANLSVFHSSIQPVLEQSCLHCHGPEKQKGKFRIDVLDPDLIKGGDKDWWLEVMDVLSNGEMPPDDAQLELSDENRFATIDWLALEIQRASRIARSEKGSSSFRRLTRYEYNYALEDLLGVPLSIGETLPPETASEDGFKNSSELLQMSPMQFQIYREMGLKALKRATVTGERPKPVTYLVSMKEEFEKLASNPKTKMFDTRDKSYEKSRKSMHLFNSRTGRGTPYKAGKLIPQSDAVAGRPSPRNGIFMALPRSNELKWNLDRFLPDDGVMRVSIRAWRSSDNREEYASLRFGLSAHTSNNANFSNVISERDIPVTGTVENPQFIHFDVYLEDIQRNPFRKLTTTFPRRDEFLHIRNVSNVHGKDPLQVHLDHIEISAPFYGQWPPDTHTGIFFDSKNKGNEEKYGGEVLARFIKRAWGRPASTVEIGRFMGLFEKFRPDFDTFEETMQEVLATVLAHPEFLYLTQRLPENKELGPTQVSDRELAKRLAVFLWSSIPDAQLQQLAEQGKLKESEILQAQVKRMLADSRSNRFTRHFVQQWLGLDGMDSVTHVTDDDLKEAMQEEPVAFFDDLLNRNGSIFDFIHSDYAVVNERLAKHYGIRDVLGFHFRKAPIEPKLNRGGLLTGSAVLAMNSDGKDSHPLKRGVWMLERILDDPPPPPPPNVPEVDLADPEIQKMTLKERIANHRNDPACYSCHARIDPWGIAFENYDALGSYRTKINNKPVDATSYLFSKQSLEGMKGLKRYLLEERQDQFARAMVRKITTYALGRPLSFSDYAEVEDLAAKFRKKGDRLGDLIHLVTQSGIFNSK